jgi:hypothetical protein
MPRNGAGTLSAPPGIRAAANTTIRSAQFNAFLDDWVSDGNAPRPISAGGTGATSTAGAQAALGVTPQGSTTDTTSGSVMINGAWGLGATAGVAVDGDDCDLITRTGFYNGVANDTLNMPTDAHAYMIQHQQYASNCSAQTAIRSGGYTYIRTKNFTASYGAWALVDTLVESGSNANGSYRKYQSGRIECLHTATTTLAISTGYFGMFRSAVVSWTYPYEFTVVPNFHVTSIGGTAAGAISTNTNTITLAFYAVTAASSQTGDSRIVNLSAVGS